MLVKALDAILKERFISPNHPSFPTDALHFFVENKPSIDHNESILNKLQSTSLSIKAVDEFQKNLKISDRELENVQNRKLSETGNLVNILKLKVDAQIMLLSNIDIEDRLVNGLVGQVKLFKILNGEVKVVYVKFDDFIAGRNLMHSDAIGRSNSWVPIHKIEVTFGLRKNRTHSCNKRTQFPLTLAWACTVHKVQGLSLDTGVISFDLHK